MVGVCDFLRALRIRTMCSRCRCAMLDKNLARHISRSEGACRSAVVVPRGPGFWATGYSHASPTSTPPYELIRAARAHGLWPIRLSDDAEDEEEDTQKEEKEEEDEEEDDDRVPVYGVRAKEQPRLVVRNGDGNLVYGILSVPARGVIERKEDLPPSLVARLSPLFLSSKDVRLFTVGRHLDSWLPLSECAGDVDFLIATNYPRANTSSLVNVACPPRALRLNGIEMRHGSSVVLPRSSAIAYKDRRLFWNMVVDAE